MRAALRCATLPELLRTLIDGLPYGAEQIAQAQAADPEVEHLYVYFLDVPLKGEQLEALRESSVPGDAVHAVRAGNLPAVCAECAACPKLPSG